MRRGDQGPGFQSSQTQRRRGAALEEIFADPSRAQRLLLALSEEPLAAGAFQEVRPMLLEVIAGVPDPDRSLINFERYCAARGDHFSLYSTLGAEPALAQRLLVLFGYSQLLADILVRSPQLLGLMVPEELVAHPASELARQAREATGPFHTRAGKLDALRRFKRREFLRIAAADILGTADFEATAQALSDLADACLEEALDIAAEDLDVRPRLAILSLGKLGGSELNYSSDIDIIFLCADEEGDAEGLNRCQAAARSALSIMGDATAEGFVFRCDARLRPEGRMGALVRTVSSALAYYEARGRPWERLALIRARPSAGDREVGEAFVREIQPFVYSRRIGTGDIRALQRVKEQLEDKTRAAGQWETHVKQGRGAIRDVEFAVELFQLLFGAECLEVRHGNCLRAIRALHGIEALTDEEAATLADGYVFMRRVEHALQIVHELPEQMLPTSPQALAALGLRLSFPDTQSFMRAYRDWTERIRKVFLRLFYGPVHKAEGYRTPVQQVAMGSREARRPAAERLASLGFSRPGDAADRLAELGEGEEPEDPETPERWAVIAERVVEACAASGRPDTALERFRGLAHLVGGKRSLYWFLSDHPGAISLLAQLCGKSPYLTELLVRRPELLDPLFEPEALAEPRSADRMADELAERLSYEKDRQSQLRAIRRYREREMLRIGLRDISRGGSPPGRGPAEGGCGAPAPVREPSARGIRQPADSRAPGKAALLETMQELTHLAEVCLRPALALAIEAVEERTGCHRPEGGFAILGMGKLGGGEIHYRSDLDVVFVCGRGQAEDMLFWERVAGEWIHVMSEPTADGQIFKVDARLRPEGKSGQLVRDLNAFERYFAQRAALWERLAAIRVRPVAGDEDVAGEAVRLFHEFATKRPLTREDLAEIRRIKERIERESKTRAGLPPLDLKLSPGGIRELEFIVQALQMHYGGGDPELRCPSTSQALAALRAKGLLSPLVGEALEGSYWLLRSLEVRLQIAGEPAGEVIDPSPEGLEDLAVRCSPLDDRCWDGPSLGAALASAMDTTRKIFVLLLESGPEALRFVQTL